MQEFIGGVCFWIMVIASFIGIAIIDMREHEREKERDRKIQVLFERIEKCKMNK